MGNFIFASEGFYTSMYYRIRLYGKHRKRIYKRNCKLIGLSIDSLEDHNLWKKDIEDVQGSSVNYPLIADEDLKIAKLYNMLPAEEKPDSSRTAMHNATVRSVFLIDPDKKLG